METNILPAILEQATRIELASQPWQGCVLPLYDTCVLWQERRDLNPNRAVLETAVLPLHHAPILVFVIGLEPITSSL